MGRVMDEELADPIVRRSYEEELLVGEATETIAALLVSSSISQRELARRLGVTEGRISQILSGSENLTLRSLASIGWSLGLRFQFDPVPMADRRGTPSESDPPSPAWLDHLYQVTLPEFAHLEPAEPPLITIGYNVEEAAPSHAKKRGDLAIAA